MKRILIIFTAFIIPFITIAEDNASKCGTFPILHFDKQNYPVVQESRPALQKNIISPGGKFRIHYDISGNNAVDLKDFNQNSIPDYIDSAAYYFDYVNNIYINQIGYKYPDDLMGGNTPEYDVYVMELGKANPSYYGLTDPERTIPGRKYPAYTSFIQIDNNYSYKDSSISQGKPHQSFNTFGFDALKVTIAHEYYHAVHFYYGLNEFIGVFSEMSSSSMEIRAFPELKDYYSYTRNLLNNPSTNLFGGFDYNSGYSYAVFGEYLFKKYGDDVMRRTWEMFSEGIYHFNALDSALKEKGSDLKSSWTEFTSWLYYTGKRAQGDLYLDNAGDFPELNFELKKYKYPSLSYANNLIPLEISPQRIIFESAHGKSQDTVDIILTACTYLTAGYPNPTLSSYSYVISEENTGGIRLPEIPYYFNLSANPDEICYNLWTYPGVIVYHAESPFPQPYNRNLEESLYIPAPEEAFSGEKAIVSIYTSSYKQIFTEQLPVSVQNKYAVFEVNDLPENLESGIYLFEVAFKDKVTLGKFAVIRK